jgi:hypothetical protein
MVCGVNLPLLLAASGAARHAHTLAQKAPARRKIRYYRAGLLSARAARVGVEGPALETALETYGAPGGSLFIRTTVCRARIVCFALAQSAAALRDAIFLLSFARCVGLHPQGSEEVALTFTIHSSKDGNVQQTLRINSRSAVERALALHDAGWDVYITDAAGRQYQPETFETLAAHGPALTIADQMIPRANLEMRISRREVP